MWKLFAIAFTLATVVYGQTTRRVTTFADEVESAVFRTYLVSELPSSGQAGKPFVVTDALVTSSGATGGGTKRILCSWNGSAWVPFDSGAGQLYAGRNCSRSNVHRLRKYRSGSDIHGRTGNCPRANVYRNARDRTRADIYGHPGDVDRLGSRARIHRHAVR